MKHRRDKIEALLVENQLDAGVIFKPENRRYFSGFTGSTGYVLITKKEHLFITDFRYTEQARLECPGMEIIEISNSRTIFDVINSLGIKSLGIEESFLSYKFSRELAERAEISHFHPLDAAISYSRARKDENEVKLIRRACEITDLAFEHILTKISVGVSEMEISLLLQNFMRSYDGVEATAPNFIIASGERASLPHGIASSKKLERGDLLMMDFGCNYKGYWSDLTRTVCVGKASKKQREVYSCVLEAQELAIKFAGPHMTGRQVDSIARDFIDRKGYGKYFGHNLGHGFGLEIHEAPRLSQNADGDIVLERGMIVTVEPGIYISGFGGVRIEDDILITDSGCEVLSKSPKNLIEL